MSVPRLPAVLAIILAGFIGLGVVAERHLATASRRMLATLALVERDANGGRPYAALGNLARLVADWSRVEKVWALLTDHHEMDQIHLALDRLKEFMAAGDIPQAHAELASLRFLLGHIPEKERLGLRSIF